jgi:hypothetical protein
VRGGPNIAFHQRRLKTSAEKQAGNAAAKDFEKRALLGVLL